jgi:hypothetical protein
MAFLVNISPAKKLVVILLPMFFAYSFTHGNYFTGSNGSSSKKIFVEITDENDQPTAAKVRITGKDSIYYAPDGHFSEFKIVEGGGDVMLDNDRSFAYVEVSFQIDVPETNLRFEVIKGYSYRVFDSVINISTGTDSIKIKLQKWFEFDQLKWYSGDVHTHYIDPVQALLEMKAEDLNVCNILTADVTNDQDKFRGMPDVVSDSNHIIYVNQEYREDRLGHMIFLNLKKLIEPVKPMREYQYPLNLKGCDETHAQGGHVSWAHFAAWPGLEGPLAIITKRVDAVELLSTIDPFEEPIFVSDVVPDLRMNSGLKLWYRLLNCGLKIPATAGTDKMNNRVTVGANRVYAQVKGQFNYHSWIDAINKGQTFITNSPFIFCHVEGRGSGEKINISQKQTITIVAEMWCQLPVNRLEILANGKVIADKVIEKGQQHAKLQIEYKPGKSVWIAARVHQFNQEDTRNGVSFTQRRDFGGGTTLLNGYYGTMRPETPFAHTNPVYVMVDNQPIRSKEDAEYFIKYLENAVSWLKQSGSFPSDKAQQEVLASYKKGIEAYRKLAK